MLLNVNGLEYFVQGLDYEANGIYCNFYTNVTPMRISDSKWYREIWKYFWPRKSYLRGLNSYLVVVVVVVILVPKLKISA